MSVLNIVCFCLENIVILAKHWCLNQHSVFQEWLLLFTDTVFMFFIKSLHLFIKRETSFTNKSLLAKHTNFIALKTVRVWILMKRNDTWIIKWIRTLWWKKSNIKSFDTLYFQCSQEFTFLQNFPPCSDVLIWEKGNTSDVLIWEKGNIAQKLSALCSYTINHTWF